MAKGVSRVRKHGGGVTTPRQMTFSRRPCLNHGSDYEENWGGQAPVLLYYCQIKLIFPFVSVYCTFLLCKGVFVLGEVGPKGLLS